jgi:hypothetical protein
MAAVYSLSVALLLLHAPASAINSRILRGPIGSNQKAGYSLALPPFLSGELVHRQGVIDPSGSHRKTRQITTRPLLLY